MPTDTAAGSLAVITSDRFKDHLVSPGHLERPERITAAQNALLSAPFAEQLDWVAPRTATLAELQLVHPISYIQHVSSACVTSGFLDPDTPVCPDSYEVARLSAGAWLTGVEELLDRGRSALVISRPPGHHAEKDTAKGFCLFANCAITVRYALEERKVKRVAVLDWDVHHGNGTQHLLEDDPRVAFCSLHQYPFFPGTGAASERGRHDNVLNIALPAGSDTRMYREVMQGMAVPFLQHFQPELLLVSCGFDATRNDPYANMLLEPEDYVEFTRMARQICSNLLVGLEGGYDLDDLAIGITGVAEALLEENRLPAAETEH